MSYFLGFMFAFRDKSNIGIVTLEAPQDICTRVIIVHIVLYVNFMTPDNLLKLLYMLV